MSGASVYQEPQGPDTETEARESPAISWVVSQLEFAFVLPCLRESRKAIVDAPQSERGSRATCVLTNLFQTEILHLVTLLIRGPGGSPETWRPVLAHSSFHRTYWLIVKSPVGGVACSYGIAPGSRVFYLQASGSYPYIPICSRRLPMPKCFFLLLPWL